MRKTLTLTLSQRARGSDLSTPPGELTIPLPLSGGLTLIPRPSPLKGEGT